MFSGPEIPMSVFFLAMAAILVLRGPFGRALAERVAGRAAPDRRELDELRREVEDVRHQVAEVQERLDFAERLLAKDRTAERLGPPA